MNKTIKTIAWICLVLGILGTTLDAGAFLFARKAFSSRQANFEEMREQYDAGELPRFKSCLDEEGEECDALNRYGSKPGVFTQRGDFGSCMTGGIGQMSMGGQRTSGWGSHPMGGGYLALPFLMIAGGPVLLVVGAVMLIVNREPAKENKKEKSKKSK